MQDETQKGLELVEGKPARGKGAKVYDVPVSRVMLVKDAEAKYLPKPDNARALVDMLSGFFDGCASEAVVVVMFDVRRKPLQIVRVSEGTLTSSMAHPREVFRAALYVGDVSAVAVAHNHPSGDPSPSPEDNGLTRRLRQAAEILAIPMLDHLIIGEAGRYFSYAESGWPI